MAMFCSCPVVVWEPNSKAPSPTCPAHGAGGDEADKRLRDWGADRVREFEQREQRGFSVEEVGLATALKQRLERLREGMAEDAEEIRDLAADAMQLLSVRRLMPSTIQRLHERINRLAVNYGRMSVLMDLETKASASLPICATCSQRVRDE